MKKRWILIFCTMIALLALFGCNKGDTIVETKAGNITEKEFYETLKKRYGESVLQELVYRKVLSDKYKVTDKEVDEYLENYFKSTYGDYYKAFMDQLTDDQKESLRESAELILLQEKAAMDGMTVTEDELKEQYEMDTKVVTVRHILVEDKDTANEVLEKLNAGEKFEDLAKEYSTDTATKDKGGELGEVDIDSNYVEAFKKAALLLDEGEISDPVQTSYGYHIIQATKVAKKKDAKNYDEMKKELIEEVKRSKLTNEDVQNAVDKILEKNDVKVKDKDFKDLFNDDKKEK